MRLTFWSSVGLVAVPSLALLTLGVVVTQWETMVTLPVPVVGVGLTVLTLRAMVRLIDLYERLSR